MSAALPPGVTIAKPPRELKLGGDGHDEWRHDNDEEEDHYHHRANALQDVAAFPVHVVADRPERLLSKQFACSGSPDSTRYQEATRYSTMSDMGWEEARAALGRLLVPVTGYRSRKTTDRYVALAEFALTAAAAEPFNGRKGDHALKLRQRLNDSIQFQLRRHLTTVLHVSEENARVLAHSITSRLRGDSWHDNSILWAMIPATTNNWVRIIEATPEQTMAALNFLRAVLATWSAKCRFAQDIAERMTAAGTLPTAEEYAEALHIADMLAFTSTRLVALYSGIMHSMPIYRMYPATPECEAIELWWPWGRSVPLVDGGPTRPRPPRKAVLDPGIITATRPTDVVKQVIQQTGMNRTTAQRLTANLRRILRDKRRAQAHAMLCEGATRGAVAKAVGLSASRISAMFKGQIIPTKRPGGRPSIASMNDTIRDNRRSPRGDNGIE
jgi:hypothetical protein